MHLSVQSSKFIAAGLACISIMGSGIGIGLIFAALVLGISRNPKAISKMFGYAILGFALTEAIALFGLMIPLYYYLVLKI